MDPPRYIPPGGEAAQVDLSLHTDEFAEVTDIGGTWHRAKAVLDTGAQWTRWLRIILGFGLRRRSRQLCCSLSKAQTVRLGRA